MTQYDQTFPIPQAFPPFSLARILAEVLADQGRTQFRTAETEKYPHVTYFFNGGYEPPYPGEERCLVPSQRVATYDLAPEMSAPGITDVLCRTIETGEPRFHPVQLRQRRHGGAHRRPAGGDQGGGDGGRVPRTGPRPARTRRAASVLITADHGNCEMMIDPVTGGVHTAHTTNPVPFVAVGTQAASLRAGGSLRDVAPTVLRLLGHRAAGGDDRPGPEGVLMGVWERVGKRSVTLTPNAVRGRGPYRA